MAEKIQKKIKAVIIGASGYTGAELVRLLYLHPHVEITALIAETNAGKDLDELYAQFSHLSLPVMHSISDVTLSDIDVAFCCLPHATSQQVIMTLPEHIRVIDLSADFRIRDVEVYEHWYATPHLSPELQKQAAYGLTEHYAEAVKEARIVACPGCYPTSMLLPLVPLADKGLIDVDNIIIDAKSGISGAGRSVKATNLFTEVNERVRAYSVGGHRHVAEVEQELSLKAEKSVTVSFTPQIVPMSRGILSTVYVSLEDCHTVLDLLECLNKAYDKAPFVSVFDNYAPQTSEVSGTNYARMGVFADRIEGRAIIISVIDNLIKGSSGQAVQNMNLMFGFGEKVGLEHIALVP